MTNETPNEIDPRPWLERPIHPALPAITNEVAIFAGIILLAFATRFYNLGARVMSHDESLHTYFSWLFYKGGGYQHNPMMHGPLQFHLIALSYFLFGASDFTARIPAALFSIATISMAWYWRRYLGRTGGLIAGFLMVISPLMLFYGRYVREDSYAVFSGVLMLYVILRYFETGARKYLYLLAIALVIHFIDKETSFMYTAMLLLFLAIYFIARVTRNAWNDISSYRGFIIALAVGLLLFGVGLGIGIAGRNIGVLGATEVASPAIPSAASPVQSSPGAASPAALLVLGGILALIGAGYFLIRGYTWQGVKSERSFDMLVLAGTFVLPMLTPFPISFLKGWLHITIPTTAPEVQALTLHDVIGIGIFLLVFFAISAAIGVFWNKDWWKLALTFWIPYTIFYTSIFTNSDGFFTGIVGSLGYWLAQQAVQRGSQPWYYYILIQIPIYEFLPFLGSVLALLIGLRHRRTQIQHSAAVEGNPPLDHAEQAKSENFTNMFALLVWWVVASIIVFSYAGEKMPWLTIHLAWPMILFTGWGLGYVVDTTDWRGLWQRRAPLVLALAFVFFTSFAASLVSVLGETPPFQGRGLDQLQNINAFLLPALVALISLAGLVYLLRDWNGRQMARIFTLVFFVLLAVLTIRASFRAAYIDYDDATEYLVYAHAATGVKDIVRQATEMSERTTGGMGINLAYDASAPDTGVSWPFAWYLRDFTNQHSFDQPTRSLRDSAIIIVDQKNFDKIEAALGPGYYRIDYIRMWWPNQDYFDLVTSREASIPFASDYSCSGLLGFLKLFKSWDFSRVCTALTNPQIRAGIIDIWLNRDYSVYAAATNNQNLTLATWQPSALMRMYIRKDVAEQTWKYGVTPTQQTAQVDPYQGKTITLNAGQIIDSTRLSVPMNAPRALAIAPDGSVYVADSRNNRILHFDSAGSLIGQWGTSSGNDPSHPNPAAPPSTFDEPWGVAVGPDGSVYVTDTWNNRIQKFSAAGQFVKAWSTAASQTDVFYGPRGLAVDANGRVYVADTGNKRIVVFDADGNYITQFGSAGLDPGQFDEPVGVTLDANGNVYVTDTWNQRVQTFTQSPDGMTFTPLRQWDVAGWYGQSLDNKPFIAVDNKGHVFITDPEGFRVIEFTTDGQLVQTWGDYGSTSSTFGLAAGIAVDPQGGIWVSDAGNNRIMRFTLP
ncbi:MAG TPA: flippase activity-associated protein Agl23 [Anaerolineales bacterium]|nr:flippase activity-associated protein Agl23 [Anaerolineales bacterium]